MKKKLVVNQENSEKRIDRFLKEEVFFDGDITRGEIIRNIRKENILVNDKKIKPSYILKGGDEIRINILEKKEKLQPNSKVKFEIIYQNEQIIVVNKPTGLQVHPDFKKQPDTLVNGLLFQFPEIKTVGDAPQIRPGIVHRLDRDTSGVLVVARNQKSFEMLKNKFKNREMKKIYQVIVFGNLGRLGYSGVIEKPLARAINYKKQVVAGEKTRTKIRKAVTKFKVVKNLGDFSLLDVFPKTGRTHQIRVHLWSLGHPVVGDKVYRYRKNENPVGVFRQLLHAKEISFELFGQKYKFEAPLPEDMKSFLKSLKNKPTLDEKL